MATSFDLSKMSVEEKLELIGEIWDSIEDSGQEFTLTAEQEAELARRDAEIDAGDTSGIPWEDVVREIRAKHR